MEKRLISLYLLGDIHFRLDQPINRKTSIFQAASAKFDFLVNYIKSDHDSVKCLNPQIVVINGDLTHRPILTMKESYQLLKILNKISYGATTTLLINIGNHDIFQRSITKPEDKFDDTFLRSFNLVSNPPQLTVILNDYYSLCLFPDTKEYKEIFFDINKRTEYYKRVTESHKTKKVISCVHSAVSGTPHEYTIYFKDLQYSELEALVYFSDIHQPFGPYTIGNTTILNTGCFLRDDLADIHKVKFGHVQLNGEKLDLKLIEVPQLSYQETFKPRKKKTESEAKTISTKPQTTEVPIQAIKDKILSLDWSQQSKDYVLELFNQVKIDD